ncbi:hypothetical protein Vretifemale_5553 [Volvox reticuliferus]|uniref:Uncharacterized protein n=1 Tax=Volvox reticuliferus TaxID=1737510 RepID=A0A8J4FIK1_9CHLO|nr:hypothetical protein Vretifemale_5553 [Volvox reticuliferus]
MPLLVAAATTTTTTAASIPQRGAGCTRSGLGAAAVEAPAHKEHAPNRLKTPASQRVKYGRLKIETLVISCADGRHLAVYRTSDGSKSWRSHDALAPLHKATNGIMGKVDKLKPETAACLS